MRMFSCNTVQNKEDELLYQRELDTLTLGKVVKEFLSYLDYTEESDNGRIFHPITLSSVRVMMNKPLSMVIEKLKEKSEQVEKVEQV